MSMNFKKSSLDLEELEKIMKDSPENKKKKDGVNKKRKKSSFIEDIDKRRQAFSKRKKTLFDKCEELSRLTGAGVMLVITNPFTKPGSPPEAITLSLGCLEDIPKDQEFESFMVRALEFKPNPQKLKQLEEVP